MEEDWSRNSNNKEKEDYEYRNKSRNNNNEGFILDTDKYSKMDKELFNNISINDLMCILMVRGINNQNPILFSNIKRLYEKLNYIKSNTYRRNRNYN